MKIADLFNIRQKCEYHWYMDELFICINNYDFDEMIVLGCIRMFQSLTIWE